MDNTHSVRQLSADSITLLHTSSESNTPNANHLSPVAQKSTNELSTSRSVHSASNRNSTIGQPTQLMQSHQQKQIGNITAEISSITLDNSNNSSSSSQPKASQQQSRPNQAQSPQNNSNLGGTGGNVTNNTVGINVPTTSANQLTNNSWQQASPTAASSTNGVLNNSQTSNGSSPGSAQRPRRSSRNLEDSSSRRSSRNARQSTSNAQVVNLVRSGAQFARPTLNLPPGYGMHPSCVTCSLFSFFFVMEIVNI